MLYYLSGIVLAGVAIAGLAQLVLLKTQTDSAVSQLKLLKRDFVTRNERASKEYALDMSFRYAKWLVDYGGELQEVTKLGVPHKYVGATTVTPEGELAFDSKAIADVAGLTNARLRSGLVVDRMNELEGIAAAFVSRVADEEAVFTMLASSFCNAVLEQYDIVSHYHSLPKSDFYTNLVTLYRIWSGRLERMEYEAVATDALRRAAKTKDEKLKPLGTEDDD